MDCVYGIKYSASRKAGAFAADVGLGILSALFGIDNTGAAVSAATTDQVEAFYVFIDEKTGEVIWQHSLFKSGNPIDPGEKYVEKVLKFFPKVNESYKQSSLCANAESGFAYCKLRRINI